MQMRTDSVSSLIQRKSATYRDFTLLFASMFSLLAGAALSPALPEMARHFREIPNVDTLVKMTLSLTALFIAIGSGLAGLLLDRVTRKGVLIVGVLITGIVGTSASLMDSLYLILASRALLGIGVAFVITSATTLIGDLFSPDDRAKFFSKQATAMKIGGIVFLLLGGILASLGWRAAFLVDLLAFLILPGALTCFNRPRSASTGLNSNPIDTRRGAGKVVATSSFAAFVGQLCFYMIPTQIPFHLTKMAHAGPNEIGIAIAVNIAFSAVSASQFHRLNARLTSGRLYFFCFVVMAIGYSIVSWAVDLPTIVIGLAVAGLGVGAIFPCATASLVHAVGEAKRGRAVGLLMSGTFIGQFLSPLFFAPLVQQRGIAHAFLYASVGLAISGVCLAVILASNRSTR